MNRRKNKQPKKGPVTWTWIVDMVWLALFWSMMIIVMEKVKWVAAKEWGSQILWVSIVASIAIIIAEVLKYTAAKRLYKLFPWLSRFVNNGRR